MSLRRSLALALAVGVVVGCDESGSKSYGAQDVADALRNHGFNVGVLSDPTRFRHVFPQAREGYSTLVVEVDPLSAYRPGGTVATGDLVVAALIFDTQAEASCGQSNVIGTCLRKGNVVVLVRDRRAQAAREALDDLD